MSNFYTRPFRLRYNRKRCSDCGREIFPGQSARFFISEGKKKICHADCSTGAAEAERIDLSMALETVNRIKSTW